MSENFIDLCHNGGTNKATQIYTAFDQLPIMLNADQLAQVLGISRAGAYQLMHAKDFPTVRIGKRMIVPKEGLYKWLEEKQKPEVWPW